MHDAPEKVLLPVCFLLLGLFSVSQVSANQDAVEVSVEDRVTVPVTLAKLRSRLKPIDDMTRVALHLPAPQDPYVYLVTFPSSGEVPDKRWQTAAVVKEVSGHAPATADVYTIDLTTPFSTRLAEVVSKLFPRTTIYRQGDMPGSEEIQIHAKVSAYFVEGKGTLSKGMTTQILLTVTDANDQMLGEIQARSSGAVRPTPYWTMVGAWAGITARSMNEAFDILIKNISTSPPLKRHLAELAQGRALPASITTTAQFNDKGALLANGRLDAGEEGVLLIEVTSVRLEVE